MTSMTAGISLILGKTGVHPLEAARCRACAPRSAATAAISTFFSTLLKVASAQWQMTI